MRAKLLSLVSATGLGLLMIIGVQGTAQAHEGYRHSYFHYFHVVHRDRDYGRGYLFHFRHDHDRR